MIKNFFYLLTLYFTKQGNELCAINRFFQYTKKYQFTLMIHAYIYIKFTYLNTHVLIHTNNMTKIQIIT